LGPAPSVDQLSAGIRDADPSVRAFATWLFGFQAKEDSSSLLGSLLTDLDPRVQRRACAAFVHAGLEAPVEPLLNLLGSEDRFLAFSARLALERVPVDKWKESILASADDRVVVQGLLALSRLKPAMISGTETMDRLVVLLRKGTKEMPAVLRMAQLAALAGASGPSADEFGKMLLAKYPTGDVLIDREMSRLIAKLQVPGSAEVFVQRLDKEPSREEQVHLALVLRYLDVGWSTDLKSRYIRWYDRSQSLDGGHSFVPYLENIVSATFPRLTPDERHDLLTAWKEHPYAARLLLRRNNPDQVTDFPALAEMLLAESDKGGVAFAGEIYDLCVDALSRSENPTCHAILRRLFDENPDRRDMLAAKIAEHPTPESRPYFIRSLVFASDTTLQFVLRALFRLGGKAESPEEIRQAIIAGLKLNENGGKIAVDLLEKWTEQKPPGSEILPNLAFYQEWFAKTYPNEPAPDLPKVDKTQVKFTVDEIMNYLETNPRGRSGDAVRGKEMYAKALCIKCHKFGQEGNGIGPDLTTLRRRFQKKEIVEAIVYPSQVVSDQYRTVTVVTADGLVQTGMLAPQQGQERVVLWLNNGDRMEIAKDDIEEQKPSSVSLMPPGLIKDLTLEDISDLFAYLETSKSNTEPGSSGSPSADTTGQGGK
jgi:putative heme-binding domain-containing protein